MLQVGDQQIARTLFRRRRGRVDELQVIEPLEVEAQQPAGAVDGKRILVLAANREAGRLERAGAAVLEPHQRHHRIVDLAAAARSSGRRP